MSSESDRRDWERVQGLGLIADVKDVKSYTWRVSFGQQQALAILKREGPLVPSSDDLKSIHSIVFRRVHEWAGKFRVPGQEVSAGIVPCSTPRMIEKELHALNKEMKTYPLKGTRQYMSEVIAFYHAQLLVIHPFLDGNGRVSRVITNAQSHNLLGKDLSEKFTREQYIEALQKAQLNGDLGELSQWVQGKLPDRKISISLQPNLQKPALPEPLSKLSNTELSLREEALIIKRKRLGFKGSETEAFYGLGGFPPPINLETAIKKAEERQKLPGYSEKRLDVVVKSIIREDQDLQRKRKEVMDGLGRIRTEMYKREEQLSKGQSKTRSR